MFATASLPLSQQMFSYPKIRIAEWQAFDPVNRQESDIVTKKWNLEGNFYVTTDYEGAVPKLGVSLAIVPPISGDFEILEGSLW